MSEFKPDEPTKKRQTKNKRKFKYKRVCPHNFTEDEVLDILYEIQQTFLYDSTQFVFGNELKKYGLTNEKIKWWRDNYPAVRALHGELKETTENNMLIGGMNGKCNPMSLMFNLNNNYDYVTAHQKAQLELQSKETDLLETLSLELSFDGDAVDED